MRHWPRLALLASLILILGAWQLHNASLPQHGRFQKKTSVLHVIDEQGRRIAGASSGVSGPTARLTASGRIQIAPGRFEDFSIEVFEQNVRTFQQRFPVKDQKILSIDIDSVLRDASAIVIIGNMTIDPHRRIQSRTEFRD